jgi:two-component SAPR family response regulator
VAPLALSDQHRLVRDRVVDALWPHLDPDAGAANLRKAAHQARQALGRDDAVRLSGGTVALFPSCEVVTDVESFEDRAATAIRSRDRTACDAVNYPGDLLPDWLDEEWTRARRDRVLALQVIGTGVRDRGMRGQGACTPGRRVDHGSMGPVTSTGSPMCAFPPSGG